MATIWIDKAMYAAEDEVSDYVDKLEAQLAAHRWIPIGDGLPKSRSNNSSEWVYISNGKDCFHAWYDYDNAEWCFNRNLRHENITHWKPITLPKGE